MSLGRKWMNKFYKRNEIVLWALVKIMRGISEAIRHGIELWVAQMKESVESFDGADHIWSDSARVFNCDETAFVVNGYSGRVRPVFTPRGTRFVQQRATGGISQYWWPWTPPWTFSRLSWFYQESLSWRHCVHHVQRRWTGPIFHQHELRRPGQRPQWRKKESVRRSQRCSLRACRRHSIGIEENDWRGKLQHLPRTGKRGQQQEKGSCSKEGGVQKAQEERKMEKAPT